MIFNPNSTGNAPRIAEELAARSWPAIAGARSATRRRAGVGDRRNRTVTELTAAGGEGMVVKPAANLIHGRTGLVQPGLKVRGRDYLRLIYGPDYTQPANLEQLRSRALGSKRSLALREYAGERRPPARGPRNRRLWKACRGAVRGGAPSG